jgi:hypothetical protein
MNQEVEQDEIIFKLKEELKEAKSSSNSKLGMEEYES